MKKEQIYEKQVILMKLSQDELGTLVFLSEVIVEGNKRHLMGDALRSLLYIAKSLDEVEVSAGVKEEIMSLMSSLEEKLKTENDRIQEIKDNLNQPAYQRSWKNNRF